MCNSQPHTASLKTSVLRLKELLDMLRASTRSHFAGDPSTKQIAAAYGVKELYVKRFWNEKMSGGPIMIKAIKTKTGLHSVCDEVLALLDSLADTYKSLVVYPIGAIELTFDLTDAYAIASHQDGLVYRAQMNREQFSGFFGKHSAFVSAVIIRNRTCLAAYDTQLDAEIRSVLKETDWTRVRPNKQKATGPPRSNKRQQLANLVRELRPRYPSERALLKALSAHQDSLKNAIAGKGRSEVMERILQKAQELASNTSAVPEPALPPKEKVEVKEQNSFIGSFISSLNSFVKMGEAAGIDPKGFTDGHRDHLIRIMIKLAALANIDDAAIKRLQSVEGLPADHPGLKLVVSALRGAKR